MTFWIIENEGRVKIIEGQCHHCGNKGLMAAFDSSYAEYTLLHLCRECLTRLVTELCKYPS